MFEQVKTKEIPKTIPPPSKIDVANIIDNFKSNLNAHAFSIPVANPAITNNNSEQKSISWSTPRFNTTPIDSTLNDWCSQLKASMAEECVRLKEQYKQDAALHLQNEILRFEDYIGGLTSRQRTLEQLIENYEETVRQKDRYVESLTQQLGHNLNKTRLAQRFCEWRMARSDLVHQSANEKLAAKLYRQRLLRNTMTAWKRAVEAGWKQSAKARHEREAQQICREMAARYDAEIAQLEERLHESERRLEVTHTAQQQSEEAVRRALMRGVCALNMETMNVIGQSAPAWQNSGKQASQLERVDHDDNGMEEEEKSGEVLWSPRSTCSTTITTAAEERDEQQLGDATWRDACEALPRSAQHMTQICAASSSSSSRSFVGTHKPSNSLNALQPHAATTTTRPTMMMTSSAAAEKRRATTARTNNNNNNNHQLKGGHKNDVITTTKCRQPISTSKSEVAQQCRKSGSSAVVVHAGNPAGSHSRIASQQNHIRIERASPPSARHATTSWRE